MGTLNVNGTVMATTGHNELHILSSGSGVANFNASINIGGAQELKIDFNGVASAVTIQNGKSLSGNGALINDVILASGGLLDPGSSPGAISTGSLTMLAGSSYKADLNGTLAGDFYDQANVTGSVLLAGGLTSLLNYSPSLGDALWIINNDGTDPVLGSFSGLPEGSVFALVSSANGQPYYFKVLYDTDFNTLNSAAGSGNDVELLNVAALPEPSSLTLLALGGLLAGWRVWRGRKGPTNWD